MISQYVPMASTLVREPFHRPGWVYEEKYDGWRMLAFKDGARVRLISRQGVDHTARFRELAAAIAQLRAPELVLDGEVCVFDEDLVSQFHLLGRPDADIVATPPVLMAFDCLRVHGVDVRGLPLHRRRAMLEDEITCARMVFPARRLADHGHAAWPTTGTPPGRPRARRLGDREGTGGTKVWSVRTRSPRTAAGRRAPG